MSHWGEKPVGCSLCSFRTKIRQSLETHMKFIHSDEKPYKCGQCVYQGKIKSQLTKHMKIHLDSVEKEMVKKHHCSHCPHKCIEANSMTTHIRTHTGEKRFPCSHCQYKAKTSEHLKSHIAFRHTGDKKFKCQLCDYSAVTSDQMTVHIRSHTGEKPYKCQFLNCSYATSQSSNLRLHGLTHGGEKPFKCGQCPYAAAQKRDFRNHERIRHSSHIPYARKWSKETKRIKMIEPTKLENKCRVIWCQFVGAGLKELTIHLNEHHRLPTVSLKRIE